MSRLRVALYHAYDEEALFGIRFYAERLHRALDGRFEIVDVRPRPARIPCGGALARILVKQVLYPKRARGVAADIHHVIDQSHADLIDALPGERTVVTCHDLYPLDHGPRWRRALYRRRVEKLVRAARIVAVSRSTAEALRGELGMPSDRIVVVPNGIDPLFEHPPDPSAVPGGLPSSFALHVGNNLPYKNLEGAIEALGRLRGRPGGPPPLVKAGTRLTSRQRRIARERGVPVIELGELSPEAVRALYSAATLLLQPSRHEGFGWPVVEAMAAGVPVVASSAGALAEIGGDAVMRVDPDDVASIAAAVARVLDDGALARELVERGHARVAELRRHDFAEEMARVFEEVAGRCAS